MFSLSFQINVASDALTDINNIFQPLKTNKVNYDVKLV